MKVIKHKPLHMNRNLYDKAPVFVQNLHKTVCCTVEIVIWMYS